MILTSELGLGLWLEFIIFYNLQAGTAVFQDLEDFTRSWSDINFRHFFPIFSGFCDKNWSTYKIQTSIMKLIKLL